MSQWIHENRSDAYQCKVVGFNGGHARWDMCVGRKCMHWCHGEYVESHGAVSIEEAPDMPGYEGAYVFGRCGLSSK